MKKRVPWYLVVLVLASSALMLIYLAIGAYGLLAVKCHWSQRFPFAVTGRSMEVAIHQPIQAEQWSFGALLWIDRLAERVVGSILLFRTSDGALSVKRIANVGKTRNGLAKFWVSSDNIGWTGADSREYGWVMDTEVIGGVQRVLTPGTVISGLSRSGKLWNLALLSYPPTQRYKTPQGDVVVQSEKGVADLASGAILPGSILDAHSSKSRKTVLALRPMKLGNKELWRYSGRSWSMISLDARQEFIKVKVGIEEIMIGGRGRYSNASPNPLHYGVVVRAGRVVQLIETPEMVTPTVVVATSDRMVIQGGVGHHFPPGVQPMVMSVDLRKVKGVWKVSKSGLMPALKL